MQKDKVVHFNLFRPENAVFKQLKNARAEIQTITCHNSDNCQLFARNECACRHGLFGGSCPYGNRSIYSGFTRRATKYHSWCAEQKKKYTGVGFLDAPKTLGGVGDYIFLPYTHMNMLESLPWKGRFIKKEDFTVENVTKLIKFRPQAMFGGEIKSYQEEIPPQFLKHLSEQMPELFQQVISADECAGKRYAEWTNIGREAILETTTPNIGQYADIHGGLWTWDGKKLRSGNSKASFLLVKKFKMLSIVPEEKQVVAITDENQVNQDTVFLG